MFLVTMLSLGLIITTELTGDVTAMHRYQFNFFVVFINWTFALFLRVTWLWGFVSRILFFIPTMYVLFFIRDQAGDEQGPINMIVPILVVALIEISVYSNMKANAHLFYKLKTVQ